MQFITWTYFLSIVGIMVAVYYAVAVLILYWHKLKQLGSPRISSSSNALGEVDVLGEPLADPEIFHESVSAEKVMFSDATPDVPDEAADATQVKFTEFLADVALLHRISKEHADQDPTSLLQSLVLRYDLFAGSVYQIMATQFLCDQFGIDHSIVSRWWPAHN
ncbi:hypothetical protein [Pseudochryseolinea flava]|uniref:Uncharacterized protein n=1 Tax=Pseudochryseolinea flava TaxID=2059302 RepID=A0A364XX82_9BACT|nr:hypothetical protein [Pseudochryseolinea flava]RAV98847.1 hypothetical protein DQQ10_21320 [Pseudochryseolinea flava]